SSTHSNQPQHPKPPLPQSPSWPNPPPPPPYPHPNLHTPSYPTPTTPSYLKPSFHTTPGTTLIVFSTSNFSKMTPCPCSPHFKTTPLRTVASIARWKEMMSQEESSHAPESSHQPSPMPVSQVTKPPSSSHRAMTHPKKKKRKTRFL
ncbi:hypothetical protein LINGRAHAP2_LOCUS2651, partial [Linum grandiflorum]